MSTKKHKLPAPESMVVTEPKPPPAESPLVFISHDSRDADLAEAFANLLTDASGGILKSFRSSDRKGTTGIEFGDEWYRAIMKKLDSATDVVALLTARSINRPWILYEAGVAKGKLETTVLGLALGVPLAEAVAGPFAQFQNSADDEDSITKLVLQLIRRHPHADPREEAVRRQVEAFRENVAAILKERKTASSAVPTKPDEIPAAKLFEEVKLLVREVPDRVAHQLQHDPRNRWRQRRRLHPGMIDELLHHPAFRDGPDGMATGVLFVTSLFRDDFPWLYEIGVDLYRALAGGSRAKIERVRDRFHRAMHVLHRSRLMEEMVEGPEAERSFTALDRIMDSLDRLAASARSAAEKRGHSKDESPKAHR